MILVAPFAFHHTPYIEIWNKKMKPKSIFAIFFFCFSIGNEPQYRNNSWASTIRNQNQNDSIENVFSFRFVFVFIWIWKRFTIQKKWIQFYGENRKKKRTISRVPMTKTKNQIQIQMNSNVFDQKKEQQQTVNRKKKNWKILNKETTTTTM